MFALLTANFIPFKKLSHPNRLLNIHFLKPSVIIVIILNTQNKTKQKKPIRKGLCSSIKHAEIHYIYVLCITVAKTDVSCPLILLFSLNRRIYAFLRKHIEKQENYVCGRPNILQNSKSVNGGNYVVIFSCRTAISSFNLIQFRDYIHHSCCFSLSFFC